MKIQLFGPTGQAKESDVSYQKTQNWYPHIDREGKSTLALYPTPGLVTFAPTPTGPIRGSIVYNNLLYVVSASTLWEITSAGVTTNRGTLNTSTGKVSMAHNGAANGQQIAIADGTDFYIYDSGAVSFIPITQFNDASTPLFNPTHVVFIDGYFICNDPSVTGRFYKSASYNGTDWDTLDFATAERDPDKLQSIIVSNRILWLIGENTAEAWANLGSPVFPFAPVQSGFSEWGTPAPFSTAEMNGSVFWLSQNDDGDRQVVMTNGLAPIVISTDLHGELNKLNILSDAYAYTYQYDGHNFYVLTFPTEGKTFVYDTTLQAWHEWSSRDLGYHRSSTHEFIFGKHLVGDTESGWIHELDWSTYTDAGDTITRIRRSKHIHAEDKAIRHNGLWVDVKEGVGDNTTPDPQIMLRFRDNDGLWSNEKWRSLGAVGEHKTRVIWRRLGRARMRVYELKVTDPVNAVLIDAYVKVEADSEVLR